MSKRIVIALFSFLIVAILCLSGFIVLFITDSPLLHTKEAVNISPKESPISFYVNEMDYVNNYDENTDEFTTINNKLDLIIAQGFNTIYFENDLLVGNKNFSIININENKVDILKHLSEYCLQQNVSLYLVMTKGKNYYPELLENEDDFIKSINNINKQYPLTGIILKDSIDNINNENLRNNFVNVFSKIKKDTNLQTGLIINNSSMDNLNINTLSPYYKDDIIDLLIAPPMDSESEKPITDNINYFNETGIKPITSLENIDNIATSYELFNLSQSNKFNGFMLKNNSITDNIFENMPVILSALNNIENTITPFEHGIIEELRINYPSNSDKIYTNKCFIMGFSDPNIPLFMNGEKVERNTEKGSFGVLVYLNYGDNEFVFTQGEKEIVHNIYRYKYTYTGGTTATHDGSIKLSNGTMIKMNSLINSTLLDYNGDFPNNTIQQGATAVVTDSVLTKRNGKTTYAYKLENGEYILSANVEQINNTGVNYFTDIVITEDEKGEYIEFVGNGTPMSNDVFTKNKITFKFYNTNINLNSLPISEFFTNCEYVNDTNLNTSEISFSFSNENPLWGYQIEYSENKTKIYFKKAPKLHLNTDKPLQDVKIMLDVGHGGKDFGALGISWGLGKSEKDYNLAVAEATKLRLEQLGAEVILTRYDDTYYTLQERNALAQKEKPDFFLSVHHNSIELTVDTNDIFRVESYCYYDSSIPFAQNLIENVANYTDRPTRDATPNYYFYVTRLTICPAVLFEYGFLVSPLEYEHVSKDETIWLSAFATAQSFIDTIKNY